MVDHQLVVFEAHGAGRFALQLRDQLVREARGRELQALELLRVDQPSGAVVLEHQLVLLQHFFAQDVLRVRETVADDLEHHVERGQREADHHQSAVAGRVHESIAALLQVAEQLAIALGLALLGAPEHRVQLAHRFARQDGLQEHDRLADVRQVDVEVRAREAEQDADGGLVHHDRVDQHAALGVLQREDERQHPTLAGNAADEVSARHLKERRAHQLDLLDLQRRARCIRILLALRAHFVGDDPHAAIEVEIRRAEAEVGEHFLEQQLERAAIAVDGGLDRRGDRAHRIQVERDELDRGVDADRAEGAARDGVEEGLVELQVRQLVDQLGKAALDAAPERALGRILAAEPLAHVRDGAIDALVVELDTLDRIALAAAPVALLEALRRAPRDGAKLGVVVGEGLNERRGALIDECVAAAGGGKCGHLHHKLRISASPNSLHFTSFAPSIRRAKSYVTVFWPIVLSIAVMIASAASTQPM